MQSVRLIKNVIEQVDLTGKYRKPKNVTTAQALALLMEKKKDYVEECITVEEFVSQHFAGSVCTFDGNDGNSYAWTDIQIVVHINNPRIYEITICVEDNDSMEDEFDEDANTVTTNASNKKIYGLWDSVNNIMCFKNYSVEDVKRTEEAPSHYAVFHDMGKQMKKMMKDVGIEKHNPKMDNNDLEEMIETLLEHFATPPKLVSRDMFQCVIAY